MKANNQKRQLYSLIRNVEIPELKNRNPVDDSIEPVASKIFKAFIVIMWPNGFPCVEVCLYLTHVAYNLRDAEDGGSTKQIAAKLSHLIRYCWDNQLNFCDLGETTFYNFTVQLKDEPHAKKIGENAREKNRVREIIATCISFFQWLQKNWTTRQIVGTRETNPQIRLVLHVSTDRFGRRTESLVYPNRPGTSTRDPKGVMPTEVRNKCWQAVAAWADPHTQSSRYRAKFRSENEFLEELRYLKSRRELLLIIVEHTGARPAEIAEACISKNHNIVLTEKLVLTTKKNDLGAERNIPVSFELALKLEVFIMGERSKLCSRLRSSQKITEIPDRVFLNLDGSGVTAPAFEKEFSRIAKRAGINTRACLSMFRHRFITLLVAQHIKTMLKKQPDRIFTDGDYQTILAKVQKVTGHKNLTSALNYIDWAWEELSNFDPTVEAKYIRELLESFIPTFISFISDIPIAPVADVRKKMGDFHAWLIKVQEMAQNHLQSIHAGQSLHGRRTEGDIPN